MAKTDFMPSEASLAAIREEVERYELKRVSVHRQVMWRGPVFVAIPLLVVAALAIAFNGVASPFEQWKSTPHVFLYAVGFVATLAAYRRSQAPAKLLQSTFRQTVLPAAFGFVQGMTYDRGTEPRSFDRLPREAIGTFNDETFDDIITGSFEGFSFELYEADLELKVNSSGETVFKGVVVAFEAATPFAGVLIATVKSNRAVSFLRSFFGLKGLEQLQSGIPELDGHYEFRTDNPEAALGLVQGRLAKALKWLGESWPDAPARIVLKGDDGFLMLPSAKNFFELPPTSVPLSFDRHIRPIIADMAAILAIAALVRKVGAVDPADPV